MRKHLFAADEILIPVDAMDLQDNAGLDMSALLAALAGTYDADVVTGIEPMFVLAGLSVSVVASASGSVGTAVVTVTPGSIVYRVADTDNVTWRVATLRDTVTLTTPLAATGYHKSVYVEATVAETITNADRVFRRELSGRVVYQTEPTPTIKQSMLTLRIREGVEVLTGANPYLPAFVDEALPLARVFATSATVTATDIRKLYRGQCGGTTFYQPLRAQTESNFKPGRATTTTIEQNYVGFGARTPVDYCSMSLWNPAFPTISGYAIPVADGYTPSANSLSYVYAYRVHPKVGAVEYVVTGTAPDADRNLTGSTPFTAPAPWPTGTFVSGSEAKYLFAQPWYSSANRSAVEVQGDVYNIGYAAPSKTFVGVTNMAIATYDVSDILPPFTMTAEFRLKLLFTQAHPEIKRVVLYVNEEVLGVSEGDSVYTPTITANGYSAEIHIPRLMCNIQWASTGFKIYLNFQIEGSEVDVFDLVLIPTLIRESFRS